MLVRRRASYKASARSPATGSPNIEDGACCYSESSLACPRGSMKFVRQNRRFGVLSEPNVKPLATATLFNAAGNNVYGVALGWLAYEATGSPLAVGAVLGMRPLTMLCVGLIAGAVNDRFHRPWILRLYALWYTLLSFGFTSLLYLGNVGVGHMLGYMFLVGVGFTFGPTARRAIYADSVSRSRVVDALAVDRTTFELGHLIMPAIVGVIISTYGPEIAFTVQCGLYSTMTLLVFQVSTPRRVVDPASRPPFLQSIGEGLGYVRAQPGILRMLFATSALALFGFAYPLVPVVSGELLDAGATGVGAILAGGAAGGLVGPVLLLALRGRVSSLTALVAGGMTMALGMAVFAFSPSLAVAVGAFAVMGATSPASKAVSDGYMQLAVDPAYRGRVGSLTQVTRGLEGLSAFLAGGIAQVVGVQGALVVAAVITGVIAVWLLVSFRRYGVEGW